MQHMQVFIASCWILLIYNDDAWSIEYKILCYYIL